MPLPIWRIIHQDLSNYDKVILASICYHRRSMLAMLGPKDLWSLTPMAMWQKRKLKYDITITLSLTSSFNDRNYLIYNVQGGHSVVVGQSMEGHIQITNKLMYHDGTSNVKRRNQEESLTWKALMTHLVASTRLASQSFTQSSFFFSSWPYHHHHFILGHPFSHDGVLLGCPIS